MSARGAGALALALALGSSGCAAIALLRAPRIAPCGDASLAPPSAFPPDYRLRAHYRAEAEVSGDALSLAFELLAFREDDALQLVGFGPLGTKAWSLRQEPERLTIERFPGPAYQLAPINVLRDLQAAELHGDTDVIRRVGCAYTARLVRLAPPRSPEGA